MGAELSHPGADTITGDGIVVRSVDLSRSVHHGTLSLRGAKVDSLSLDGTVLRSPGGYALHADHLEVATYLHGNNGFTADGEVCLNDAHIGTVLDLKGARLRNPGGSSLAAIGMRADAVMNCCEGFDSVGAVELYHAQVGQRLCFKGARLSNPDGVAIWAEQLQARADEVARRVGHEIAQDGAARAQRAEVERQRVHDEETQEKQRGGRSRGRFLGDDDEFTRGRGR